VNEGAERAHPCDWPARHDYESDDGHPHPDYEHMVRKGRRERERSKDASGLR
jgi:hypothetical protein